MQASVAVGCALAGFGAWSMIFGLIAAEATHTLVVWILVPWRPSPRDASFPVLRKMLRYGRFVSLANLSNLLNHSMDNLVVGRVLGSAALGVYALAWRFAELPTTVIGPIVGRAMFSVYSQLQDDLRSVRRVYVQNMQRTVTLGLAPPSRSSSPPTRSCPRSSARSGPPQRILCASCASSGSSASWSPAGELFKGIGKPHTPPRRRRGLQRRRPALADRARARLRNDGAGFAMVLAILSATVVTLVNLVRELKLPLHEFLRALARPVACSLPLAATLLLLLPVSDKLSPGWGSSSSPRPAYPSSWARWRCSAAPWSAPSGATPPSRSTRLTSFAHRGPVRVIPEIRLR